MKLFFAASTLFIALSAAACSVAPEAEATATVDQADTVAETVVRVVDTTAGKILADKNGRSLYTFDNDITSDSTCYDACLAAWPALIVPDDQALAAPFGVTTRTDGKKQVTQSGKPLYYFVGDGAPGDIKGEGLGGVWHLARPATP